MARTRTPSLNPLSSNDIAAAKAAIESLAALKVYWGKCTDCTIDVKPFIDQAEALTTFFKGVIDNFEKGAGDG